MDDNFEVLLTDTGVKKVNEKQSELWLYKSAKLILALMLLVCEAGDLSSLAHTLGGQHALVVGQTSGIASFIPHSRGGGDLGLRTAQGDSIEFTCPSRILNSAVICAPISKEWNDKNLTSVGLDLRRAYWVA